MASIVKRKSKFSVVYTVTDAKGVKHQKWETYATMADAKKRKAQVEFQISSGTFICPDIKTMKELLDEYIHVYGVNTWAASTFDSKVGLINNYIIPLLGNVKLTEINTRMMNQFYQNLLRTKMKPKPYQKGANQTVSPRTVREIHKLLRNTFNQAVKWELMDHNPVQNCTVPKSEEKKRAVWEPETLYKALQACEDPILELSLNLAFSCSLRMGELLGLTWDCVEISQNSIERNQAYIYINKELQRVTKATLEMLGDRDVIYRFPAIFARNTTALIMKPPKTKTSIRKVYLPKTVAEMLVERKKEIDEMIDLFGDEYENYNLVICGANGRPIEGAQISRSLQKLIRDNNLPPVVFHSIRHTSTSYKLKLSGGDIKAVQGDTGHAQATMVTERYAHIFDDDRRRNTERMEKEFYEQEKKEVSVEKEKSLDDEVLQIAELLKKSPELMNLLKTMVNSK